MLDGNDDPEIARSVLQGLEQTRIHAKQASDAWITEVLALNIRDTQDRLATQKLLFTVFAPFAAVDAVFVVVLGIRAQGNARLQAENEKLVGINEEKTHFVTQVSHELKTPLTSVIAFTDIIIGNSDQPLTLRQSSHLKIIKRNAEYLRLLVDDIVDVSQLETGLLKVDLEDINARRLLIDLESSFAPIVERKQQTLTISDINDSLTILGDHQRLLQVLSNLVGNATKYSEPGTEITISAVAHLDSVVITVRDQGFGMTSIEQSRAFDMFYRGTSVDIQKESGTGIGLAVSRSIIEAHNGKIWIENVRPTGTKMLIRIPRNFPKSEPGVTSLFVA